MLTIQRVFDRVISQGLYKPSISPGRRRGMCAALGQAFWEVGIINVIELEGAIKEIEKYLEHLKSITGREYLFLDQYLEHLNIPPSIDSLLAIYRDWNNRPMQIVTQEDV